MTEINIILNTQFQNIDDEVLKNDKEIFYEELNRELNLYKYNSYKNYRIEYNQIVNDFIFNDNYLEYQTNLHDINIDIKKLLIKKLLIFLNPIINNNNLKYSDIFDNFKSSKKKDIIVEYNSIILNYPLDIKIFLEKNKKFIKRRANANFNLLLSGFYNNKRYNNNLSYKLNNYKFINKCIINLVSKHFDENIHIYLKGLNYNNQGIIDLNKINNNNLKDLFMLYLQSIDLYFNNHYVSKPLPIFTDIKMFNNLYDYTNIELVDKLYNKNYINQFNTFLSYKINNNFNNHSYYAFEANNLLNLYERILVYSIDNKDVKNTIKTITDNITNEKIYKENQKIINEYNLKQIQLELLTRNKFPNLFNPNSKEVIFYKYKTFNFEDLPKKYKDIILIDYKKLQNYTKEYNKNKCKHKELINQLSYINNKYPIVEQINKLISQKDSTNNDYYKCMVCSFNLICPHIIDYYNLLFKKTTDNNPTNDFSIRQHILNKYMTNAKVNMIYYCKICGEELGKSLDLDQNIEYKDKVKLNTAEYTDDTMELVKTNINYIIYSYVLFTELNLNITKKFLINYVNNTILFYINNIEKTLRKSKLYAEDKIQQLLNFNSIIFTYATLIFIMSKYPFITFIQPKFKRGSSQLYSGLSNIIVPKITINGSSISYDNKNIIVPKKINLNNPKELLNVMKNRFKDAFDLIISTNNILLYKLDYVKNSDKIKELLIKTYSIVAKTDQILLSDVEKSNITNSELLVNSSIYNYLYNITKIYPLSSTKSNFSTSIFNDANLYKSQYNNIKFSEFSKVLNKDNVNSKIDELFNTFKSPIIENLDSNIITSIKDYNHYKLLSFNLFYYHIKNKLYNYPIYEIISLEKIDYKSMLKILSKGAYDNLYLDKIQENNKVSSVEISKTYINYIKLSQLVKQYEILLINKTIKFNLYPYSFLKLNNIRYYTKQDINLNLYFCSKDGLQHKYNIYLFNQNKNNIEIEKNKIDKFINSIDHTKYKDLKFIDYKCSKCNQLKNKVYDDKKYDNSKIDNLIDNMNDINGFFNLYINICPITNKNNDYQFHNFNYENIKDNQEIICTNCKIDYYDLLNKNVDIYNKYSKSYEDYKEQKTTIINNKLIEYTDTLNFTKNINISDYYNKGEKNTHNNKYIENINNLNIDNLIIDISKKYNIDMLYLTNLGCTEGYNYEDINSITIDYNIIDNRMNKLNTYLRSLFVYYNLLKNNKFLDSHYDTDFNQILQDLKEINIKLFKELKDYNINLSNILTKLKLTKNNKEIIEFLLKAIYNFILDIEKINKSLFNNKLKNFIEFSLYKILKFDELFTKFNYSKLKQMFNEDNYDISFVTEKTQEYENEEDDDLFGYNDLNINFEDEEPLDE